MECKPSTLSQGQFQVAPAKTTIHGLGGNRLRRRPLNEDLIDLQRVEYFLLQQRLGKCLEARHVVGQDTLGTLVIFRDQTLDLVIDFQRDLLAEVTLRGNLSAEENFLFLPPERQRSQLFTHADRK